MRVLKHLTISLFSLVTFISFSYGQVKSKSDVEALLKSNSSQQAKVLLTDGTEYTVKDSHTDESLGIEHVYLQQTYKSIIVFNVIKSMRSFLIEMNTQKNLTDKILLKKSNILRSSTTQQNFNLANRM